MFLVALVAARQVAAGDNKLGRTTVKPPWQKCLFDALYGNRYLYRVASTVPFAGQWRVWQRLVLPRLHGRSVLELGCGLGDLLADMIEEGYNCRAIEQSPEMVEAAREILQERSQGKPNWIIQGQAQRLPFTDASFDNVVSTFPNEYICDPNTIAEVERVLNPGGRLIVLIGAKLLPVNPIQSFLLLIQLFVYGPAVFFRPGKELQGNRETSTGITTEVVPDAWFAKHIPLEQHGLRRCCEIVRSRRWEVYIVSGEKAEQPSQ